MNEGNLRDGVHETTLDGVRLRVTSPARTIADCFKLRRPRRSDRSTACSMGFPRCLDGRTVAGGRADTHDHRDAAVPGITVMSATNLSASVRALLRNLAERDRVDFGFILARYGLERMLYRLSVGESRDQCLLKGALLFDVCGSTLRHGRRETSTCWHSGRPMVTESLRCSVPPARSTSPTVRRFTSRRHRLRRRSEPRADSRDVSVAAR